MTMIHFLTSNEIELGNWLNGDNEELVPEFLPDYLREIYDCCSENEGKFSCIYKKLGREKVSYALLLSNECEKMKLQMKKGNYEDNEIS